MKLYDKVLIIIYASIYAMVYSISNIAFEMTSENFSTQQKLALYIITLFPVGYYSFKYIGPQKGKTYFITLMGSALLWVTVLYLVNKTQLLYYAANNNAVTTTLKITKVSKQILKNSFEGSKIHIDYDNRIIELQSSRINYFAFLNKKSFKGDIGKTDADNYYISKIYWQPGELARARITYWQYWLHRMRYIPFFIVGMIILVPVILYFKKMRDAKSPPPPQTKARAVILILKITGAIFALFLVAYLCLLAYMYFKYGHIG